MKKYKVVCPVQDENTGVSCSLHAGLEIYKYNEVATPPHAVLDGEQKCKCYLVPVFPKESGHFSTGVEQPQNFPNEELPRCACTDCEKCGQINWVYKGKVGCGNGKCEAYAMGEAHQMYADSLEDFGLDAVAKVKLAKWFEKPLGKLIPGIFSTRHPEPQPHLFEMKFESGLTTEQVERINKLVKEMTKGGDWKKPVFLDVDCEVTVESDHATWLKHKRASAKKELKELHRKQLGLKHSARRMEQQFSKYKKARVALANHCIERHSHPGDVHVDLSLEYHVLFNDFDASVRTLKHLRLYLRKSKANAARITELQLGLKNNFTTIVVT